MITPTLPQPPISITQYHEIAVTYNKELPSLFNTLSAEERVFCYYLLRASLPGNRIFADQVHRHSNTVIELFEKLDYQLQHNTTMQQTLPKDFPYERFAREVNTYLVYLWTNHGQYFQREHNDEKRTPEKLNLTTLTYENGLLALNAAGLTEQTAFFTTLRSTIFETTYEATSTVPGFIDQSAVNIYGQGVTDALYETLPEQSKQQLNAYFYTNTAANDVSIQAIPYAVNQKYSDELSVSVYWLTKAHEHATNHPQYFDKNLIKSLQLLIGFLNTGDEELFKEHTIAWLASSSRVDYNFGFIETYQDPKGVRGFFQAEATIKALSIDKLNAILPSIEAQLPFPAEFKRAGLDDGTAPIPNASINVQIFGTGALGPLSITAAYCLPNYEEIRARYGSKQIIYPATQSIEQRLNADVARNLFNLKKTADWLKQHDPAGLLANDIWDAQCILHETIGHASGNLAQHTITPQEAIKLGNPALTGSSVTVTNKNLSEFLSGYESTIEELRAEIIALYVSIHHLPELQACGLLNNWHHLLSEQELIDELIIGMASTGLRRLIQQSETATEIAGDHARANYCILNYLVDHEGLSIQEETILINDQKHTVVGLIVRNREQVKKLIQELMILVQTIKSTANYELAANLIETYGRKLRNTNQMKALQQNKKTATGNIKVSCLLYPIMEPILSDNNKIVDIQAHWPSSIDSMEHHYRPITLSKK